MRRDGLHAATGGDRPRATWRAVAGNAYQLALFRVEHPRQTPVDVKVSARAGALGETIGGLSVGQFTCTS